MNPYFRDYSDFLASRFEGKVQKLSVDAAMGCPNRDGTVGHGGCIYCNNRAFSPDWQKHALPVGEQIARGKAFFSRKYPQMRYLAYFQSYTSTHAPLSYLLELYREALAQPDVVGLIIGTRPDCMPDLLLEGLKALKRQSGAEIFIEFGAESMHDSTLRRINRCHDSAATADAVARAADAGFPVGLHLILGLPGENRAMMLESVRRVNALPVDTVKFHQLQILRDTPLAAARARGEFADTLSFTPEEYAALCADIVELLRPDIAIERFVAQAPPDMLIEPQWGLKNYQFMHLLQRVIENRRGAQ